MPYRDYVCSNCGHELVNVKKNIHDVSKPVCPKCNMEMDQVFDDMNFIKKGKGWTPKSGGGRVK
jgi:putative FmdB family regulatory protein